MNATMNSRAEFEKWAVQHDVDITKENDHLEDYRDFNTDKLYNCWVCAQNLILAVLSESLKKELEKS